MGQKLPLTLQVIWSSRMRLTNAARLRELALFNLAIDSKLRACDLLKLRISDISSGSIIRSRAMILQSKTNRQVRFEITARTRKSIDDWIQGISLGANAYLFPSRIHG